MTCEWSHIDLLRWNVQRAEAWDDDEGLVLLKQGKHYVFPPGPTNLIATEDADWRGESREPFVRLSSERDQSKLLNLQGVF